MTNITKATLEADGVEAGTSMEIILKEGSVLSRKISTLPIFFGPKDETDNPSTRIVKAYVARLHEDAAEFVPEWDAELNHRETLGGFLAMYDAMHGYKLE